MGPLSIYLDTSVIVPFFLADPFVSRARAFLHTEPVGLLVSDFVSAEFASVIGRRVRMKLLSTDEARAAFSNFDTWVERATTRIEALAADIRTAEGILRRLDLTLRTPDALNIAIAQRANAILATFDAKMAESAGILGTEVSAL
jgi:uncharacterized protein